MFAAGVACAKPWNRVPAAGADDIVRRVAWVGVRVGGVCVYVVGVEPCIRYT